MTCFNRRGSTAGTMGEQGLTLFEVMITLVLTSVLVGGLSIFFVDYVDVGNERISRLELQRQGTFALAVMEKAIRESYDSSIDMGGTKITTAAAAEGGGSRSAAYSWIGDAIEENGTTLVPDTHIEGIRVTNLQFVEEPGSADVVRIDLELTDAYGNAVAFTTAVGVRNTN